MKKNAFFVFFVQICCVMPYAPVAAEDEMKLELSVIKGNKELPKVLYIMPWKRLPSDNMKQKLILHSLFEDVFEPLEPESFQQQVENYQHYIRPK